MKDHYDFAPAGPRRRFPRFGNGQAVAVTVPLEPAFVDVIEPVEWVTAMHRSYSVTPGRMLRVMRVLPLCCHVLDVRSLIIFEIEKACLCHW